MPELRSPLHKINNYQDHLEKCWEEHLQPKDNAPTVISLFAGCGGSSLGYSMAGFRELMAVEWDSNAVATFRFNFDCPVFHGDIAKLSVEEILATTGLKIGELDVLDGSPPCQGFSIAGKRILDDPRNQLFIEYVRILKELQPKAFVMENVSGMVKGKMKLIFAEILRTLKDCGYRVSVRVLKSQYFGVPQTRERLIFIGVRNDLPGEPSHPVGETIPVRVIEAWGASELPGNYCSIRETSKTYKYFIRLKQGQSIEDIHPKGSYFNYQRLDYLQPSCTLLRESGDQIFHPIKDRFLTVEEFKRLGSFPDQFKFIGSALNITERIGNSVPPLLMRAIAKHVKDCIL